MQMEKRSRTVEVLGVPDVLPAARTVEKLQVHFLSARHGGGEVLQVLYPCYLQGQAFISFEEPEVAARVLRHKPHVLELNHQRYDLTVEPLNRPEMNFPVAATVQLHRFSDQTEVLRILRSHSFRLEDMSGGRVRVRGSFSDLRAVKAHLEQLENQRRNRSPSKIYREDGSHDQRNKSGDRGKPPNASTSSKSSPSSPVASSFFASSPSPPCSPPVRSSSLHRWTESFMVDADVFNYADRFRKKNINDILQVHQVKLQHVQAVNGCYSLTLQGRRAKMAAGKLQSLLDSLGGSLRTQEVPLDALDQDARRLLQRIQQDESYKSVLVCHSRDGLRLIGDSHLSYELKEKLCGSGRSGRSRDRNSGRRSSSLPPPPRHQKPAGRRRDVAASPSPVRHRDYYPIKYQDVTGERAETQKTHTEMVQEEKRKETTPPEFLRKTLLNLPKLKDMKQKLKSSKK